MALLVALALATPSAAQAASTGSVTMVSQPGDYLGAGQQYLFDSATGSVSLSGSLTWAAVEVSGGNDLTGYGFRFEFAPPSGEQLQVGEYVQARRYPFEPADLPGISIEGDGRGCDNDYGRFLIKDIHAEASGKLDRLWLLYETRCDAPDHPALFGEIRIGEPEGEGTTSAEPTAIAWPQTSVGETGSIVPVTVVAGSGGAHISNVTVGGTDAADFQVLGGDCVGATLAAASRCQVEVAFDPLQAGDREAQLYVESSDKSITSVGLTFRAMPSVSSISPSLGPPEGGTAVTIHGNEFTGASAVMFGSTASSSFTVDSPTEITAISPSGTIGPQDVTVTGPRGTSLTGSGDVFNYATVPGAPSGVSAKIEEHRASVSFMTADAHGSTITHYTATASPGGETASGSGSPITIAGLSGGTTYTFTVTATNAVGTGPASEPSEPVAEGGQIAGRVTSAATKAPIAGVESCAARVPVTSLPGTCALTNANGEYTIPSLPAGEYIITFIAHEPQYEGQYYNHKYDYSEAEPVLVAAGQTTAGIDGELAEVGGSFAGELAGRVTDASTKAAIQGIEVCAYEYKPSGEYPPEHCAITGASGEYALPGLPPGEYIVEFADPAKTDLNYVRQFYSAKSSFSEATRVQLPASTTRYHIDAELSMGGRISGKVTNASTGAAVEEALACASVPNSEIGECAITNSLGEYTIPALAAGRYVVEFLAPGSYLMQYYDDTYVASEARLVTVAVEATTARIDAAMQPGVFKAPVDLMPPGVSGATVVGGTLSCAGGSWSANPPPSFAYVWLRDGTPIPSATQSAYIVQGADAGHSLTCEIEATNRAVGKRGVGRAISSAVAITMGSPSAAVGPSSVAKPPESSSPVVVLEASKIRIVKRHTARVRIRCEHSNCQGSIELVAQAVGRHGARRLGAGHRVILAKGSFALAAGRSAMVRLHLTSAGVKQLTRTRAHRRLLAQLMTLVHGGKAATKTIVIV